MLSNEACLKMVEELYSLGNSLVFSSEDESVLITSEIELLRSDMGSLLVSVYDDEVSRTMLDLFSQDVADYIPVGGRFVDRVVSGFMEKNASNVALLSKIESLHSDLSMAKEKDINSIELDIFKLKIKLCGPLCELLVPICSDFDVDAERKVLRSIFKLCTSGDGDDVDSKIKDLKDSLSLEVLDACNSVVLEMVSDGFSGLGDVGDLLKFVDDVSNRALLLANKSILEKRDRKKNIDL